MTWATVTIGAYGSEISTPNLDQLVSEGVMFTNFHTGTTCSPSRSMLLTGLDNHRAGFGNMAGFIRSTPTQQGKPGYLGLHDTCCCHHFRNPSDQWLQHLHDR
ncbi:MAG UNVERIFIED_CONTAM: sulfatase-like hydrolase/transferase [Anaerolineae bacterium]|jgi:arylsulfatase